ncbi:uncharacterized protein PAC_00905 [Phialocephala subalpina]|uniref:C2H2-type domain-containing protein n=1 Tax=Phialocephala subalpina TaxID=576137 RepID=A0A1L7WE20_9HELO|nr:uncharacterized protein PAC_00905 [Phialocephala subalpina]
MDASNATELASSAENALFFEGHLLSNDSPASYPEFLRYFEESEPCEFNVDGTTYTSTSTATSTSTPLLHYDYDYSYRSDGNEYLVQETNPCSTDDLIKSWIVSDNTPQSCPPVILSHDLDWPWYQTVWDCPSITSDTSCSASPASTSRVPSCDWPECSHLEFSTTEEHKIHTKAHACDVRKCWRSSEPFNRCTWHKCSSQARLKTSKLFEDHINNIHINPLLCTRDGCKHKTPFRGKADLQRHIDSVHGNTPKIRCPYQTCQSSSEKPYSRKDKLINHLRKAHDTDRCPYHHCVSSMFSSPDDCESTAKHIGKMHGEYECALKSCFNTRSQFSEESLMAHLQLHHDMNWEWVLKTRDIAKREGRILRDQHLVGQFEFSDCTSCTKLWFMK